MSRRVAALEAQLGERLLLRTTRKLTVTEFGHGVLEHARHVVEEVEAAASLAQNRQVEPSGRLRVSMPSDFANLVLGAAARASSSRSYPAISLEVDLSARFVDLIGENFDVAIRMGDLRDDAIARRPPGGGVHRQPVRVAGLPRAARHAVRARGADGARHAADPRPHRRADAVGADRGDQRWEGIPPGRATANSPELLMRWRCDGAGIAAVNDHFAMPYLQRGELVQVLPDWRMPPVSAWAVFPGRRLMPARTRVFLDALAAKFTGPECQAVEARVATAKSAAAARIA